MEQVTKVLHSAWAIVQPWAQRNVTFGLVLAVCTEVPRWVFAFKAAHEPIWAGCALAVLISYAAAHAWEEYFERHDNLLLTLNGLSLFFGVYTIAPVLYLMSSAKDHSTVALSDVFPTWFIGTWAFVLSCTTFLPLIQVAVVEVRRRERMRATGKSASYIADDNVATMQGDMQPNKRTRALQLHDEGFKPAHIASEVDAPVSTVQSWIRRQGAKLNGVHVVNK